jgi:hypothetical protein
MRLQFNDLSNSENISQAFGFPVPLPFAEFLKRLYEFCNQDNQKCAALFENLTGQMLDGARARYPQTPPELFPIASMGVDGVHFGFVIHAPEITAEDYPIGEICPMDTDGVILLGNNTREALENLAGYVVNGEKDQQQLQEILKLYKLFGLQPNEEPNKTRFSESGNGLPVIPKIPVNWFHVPTSDGIGVLASSENFRNESFALIKNPDEPEEYIGHADQALLDNFPATALYYLREGFWNHWTNHVHARSFSSRMIQAYKKLHRPQLAEVVEQSASKYFKGKNVR